MSDMDKIFRRIAESFVEHDISVDRITWLSGIGMDDNGARDYLQEEILSDDESLKEIFGKEIGNYLSELVGDDGDIKVALDELLLLKGWIVQVSYRPPDPKSVKFKDGRPCSWTMSSWLTTKLIYSAGLSTALCKALLWGHRRERQAIAEARRLEADGAKVENMGLRGERLAYGKSEIVGV